MAVPAITNNAPVSGSITWGAFTIQYNGVGYQISAGSTAARWVWWRFNGGASVIEAGADIPSDLNDDDLVLFGNKNGVGIRVQATSIVDGELLVDGSVFANAIAVNQIVTEHMQVGGIDGDRIKVNSLDANTILAGSLVVGGPQTSFADHYNPRITTFNGVSGGQTKTYHNVHTHSETGNAIPGSIVIETPITLGNYMCTVRIRGYNYRNQEGGEIDATVSFYANNTPTPLTANHAQTSQGSLPVTFRLAHKDGKVVLIIDNDVSGIWYYPKIAVIEAIVGHTTPPDSFVDGWTSLRTEDLSPYTIVLTPQRRDINDTHSLTQGWRTTGTTTINGGKITTDSITAVQIAANTITATQIAANTITAAQIVAGTITATQIAAGTITATQIAANAITTTQLAANAVTAAKITAGTITATQIAANAITTTQLAANAVTAAKIVAGTITATQIAAGTITANEIAAGAITTDKLVADGIHGNRITAYTLAADKIVAYSLTTANMVAGGIDADRLVANSITANQIAANAITASKISGDAIDGKTITGATMLGGTFKTNTGYDDIEIVPGTSSVPSALVFRSDGTKYDTSTPASISSFDTMEGVFSSHLVRVQGAKYLAGSVIPRIDIKTRQHVSVGTAVIGDIEYHAGGSNAGVGTHQFLIDGALKAFIDQSGLHVAPSNFPATKGIVLMEQGSGYVDTNGSGMGTYTHNLNIDGIYHVILSPRGNANPRIFTVDSKNANNFTVRVHNGAGGGLMTSVNNQSFDFIIIK